MQFIGYDPGGNRAHGVATIDVSAQGAVTAVSTRLVTTGEDARAYFAAALTAGGVTGIGVDTLTEWCLGSAGWRPADTWLKTTYPKVQASVDNPNHINGSMCLNGMGVIHALKATTPCLIVTETHPKVLYFALAGTKYDWLRNAPRMRRWLFNQIGCAPCNVSTDHEFDALLSAWACMQGVLGHWPQDLHALPATTTMVRPVGTTKYFWP